MSSLDYFAIFCKYTAHTLVVEATIINEVEKIFLKLENNKVPEKHTIPSKCLKKRGRTLLMAIHELTTEIWSKKEIPSQWKKYLLIYIYKKGNKMVCSSYRGIFLIDNKYKVFSLTIPI